jgi:hypothetical protein
MDLCQYICIAGSSNGFCTDSLLWIPAQNKGLLNTPYSAKSTGGETGAFSFVSIGH